MGYIKDLAKQKEHPIERVVNRLRARGISVPGEFDAEFERVRWRATPVDIDGLRSKVLAAKTRPEFDKAIDDLTLGLALAKARGDGRFVDRVSEANLDQLFRENAYGFIDAVVAQWNSVAPELQSAVQALPGNFQKLRADQVTPDLARRVQEANKLRDEVNELWGLYCELYRRAGVRVPTEGKAGASNVGDAVLFVRTVAEFDDEDAARRAVEQALPWLNQSPAEMPLPAFAPWSIVIVNGGTLNLVTQDEAEERGFDFSAPTVVPLG